MNPLAVIALSSLAFALMAVTSRWLASSVPAAEQVVVRHLVGLSALTLFYVGRRRRPLLRKPGLLALRGLFGGGAVLLYFVAIEHLGAAPATVLNYTGPVFATLFAVVFLKERPPRLLVVGIGLATAGSALVTIASGDFKLTSSVIGALAGTASCLLGGAAMATVKAAREDADAPTVFLSLCCVGLVMSAPIAAQHWVPLEGRLLAACIGMALLALMGQMLFTWGMGHTTATSGSAMTQLVPVFAWMLAIGGLGERVQPLAVVGAVLCIGGVLAGLLFRQPAPAVRLKE